MYGGFPRRFLDPNQRTNVSDALQGPIITLARGNDIERIRQALDQIKTLYTDAPIPELSRARIRAVRARMVRLARRSGGVTWPMLWRAMLSEEA